MCPVTLAGLQIGKFVFCMCKLRWQKNVENFLIENNRLNNRLFVYCPHGI